MKEEKEKRNIAPERYEAPEIEIVEVAVEKGFQQSAPNAPVSPTRRR